MPPSLDALASLMGGGAGAGKKGNGLRVVPADQWDPSNLGDVPDTSELSGPGLEFAGRQYAGVQTARDRAGRQATLAGLPSTSAKLDQLHANAIEDAFAHNDPTWTPFFGAMGAAADRAGAEGKSFKMGDFGTPELAEGRRIPGTAAGLEPIGPTVPLDLFADSGKDPSTSTGFGRGSMANRSGLSTQALRILSGRGGY